MHTIIAASIMTMVATLLSAVSATPITTDNTLETANVDSNHATLSSGRFTYYYPGLGACGMFNGDGDLVVALSHVDFDPHTPNGNPNHNSLCGRRLRASYSGKSVEVTVVDRCPSCNSGDLDLSPAAFNHLADLSVGTFRGTWNWI
ncbi:hypothetical protein VTI28DRAFT_10507 [Corynascus sepedonium]